MPNHKLKAERYDESYEGKGLGQVFTIDNVNNVKIRRMNIILRQSKQFYLFIYDYRRKPKRNQLWPNNTNAEV